jgi:hypothetical protein
MHADAPVARVCASVARREISRDVLQAQGVFRQGGQRCLVRLGGTRQVIRGTQRVNPLRDGAEGGHRRNTPAAHKVIEQQPTAG